MRLKPTATPIETLLAISDYLKRLRMILAPPDLPHLLYVRFGITTMDPIAVAAGRNRRGRLT
jgi:hypothetical protein